MELFGRSLSIEEHEDKIDLFRKYQRYVYALAIILLGIYLFLSIITPKVQHFRRRRAILKNFQKTLNLKKERVLDKENIMKELNRKQGLLEEKKTLFFTEDTFNEFSINALPKLAEQFGNKMSAITYTKSKETDDGILIYPIELSLEGDFFGLVSFFYELEQYENIVKINHFTLQRKTVSPVILDVKMEVDAYIIQ